MGILVHESLYEMLSSNEVYDIKTEGITELDNGVSYRYYFITKNDIQYNVLLTVKDNGSASINFDTRGLSDDRYSSIIALINAGDTIKVLNTLKSIISKHSSDIDKLVISSSPERLPFYEKILGYLDIEHYYDEGGQLVGIMK